MPFRLERDDASLTAALHRLAEGELSAALARLPSGQMPDGAGVHDVRKRIKKLRGLLRLLRSGLPAYEAENAALREAAAGLSSLRDAAVRLATFDALVPRPAGALAALRAMLEQEAAPGATSPASVAASRALLASVLARVPGWKLRGKDRAILLEGLGTTRRKARKAMAAARAEPTIEAMHDWRKRAKDVWYQARLFHPVWPEAIGPIATTASDLTEELGRHHDLAVLADHVAALPPGSDAARAGAALFPLVQAAQAEIERLAFPQGARLLAGDPDAMAGLWVEWWRAWHD